MVTIDVQAAVEEGLRAGRKERYFREIGNFYPSEALVCHRKMVANILGTSEEDDNAPLGLFKMAVAAEDALITTLREYARNDEKISSVDDQVRVLGTFMDVNIRGYADFVVRYADGTKWVGEIKSTNNIGKMMNSNEPQVQHRAQLMLYLGILGIPSGAVVYVDRSDVSKIHQFDEDFDQDFFDDIIDHYQQAYDYIRVSKQVPPPEPSKYMPWECHFCSMRNTCIKERNKTNPNHGQTKILDVFRRISK